MMMTFKEFVEKFNEGTREEENLLDDEANKIIADPEMKELLIKNPTAARSAILKKKEKAQLALKDIAKNVLRSVKPTQPVSTAPTTATTPYKA